MAEEVGTPLSRVPAREQWPGEEGACFRGEWAGSQRVRVGVPPKSSSQRSLDSPTSSLRPPVQMGWDLLGMGGG